MVRVLADGRGLVKLSATQTAVANGEDDLSSWTTAELEYGAKRRAGRQVPEKAARDRGGSPRRVQVNHKMTKAFELLKESVHDAVALLPPGSDDR